MVTNIRGHIIHRIKILRDAIEREERQPKPDMIAITSFINRKNELESVLSECKK